MSIVLYYRWHTYGISFYVYLHARLICIVTNKKLKKNHSVLYRRSIQFNVIDIACSISGTNSSHLLSKIHTY